MTTQRQERVAHMLREEISRIIHRELKDPRIGMVSITEVELTPDLRHARVFVSVFGGEEQSRATFEVLDRAAGFVRSELAKRVRMRYVPELQFRPDDSFARGARISALLEQVKRESAPLAEDPDDSGRDPAP